MKKLFAGASALVLLSTAIATQPGCGGSSSSSRAAGPTTAPMQGTDIWAKSRPTTLIFGVTSDLALKSVNTANAMEAFFVKQGGTGFTGITYLVYDTQEHLNDGLVAGEIDFALESSWGHADALRRTNGTAKAVLARDTDAGQTSSIVVKATSGIATVDALLAGGNRELLVSTTDELEGSSLPLHQLTQQGKSLQGVVVVTNDGSLDSLLYPVGGTSFVYADMKSATPQADAAIVTKDQVAALDSSLQVIWTSPPYQRGAWTALETVDAAKLACFQQVMTSMTTADADAAKVLASEKCASWVVPTGASFADHTAALALPALPRTVKAVMPPGSPAGDAQGSALTAMPALTPGIVLSGPNNKVKQFSAAQKFFRLRGTDLTFKLYDNRRTMVSAMLAGSGIHVGYLDSTNSTRFVDLAGEGNVTAILWGEIDAWNSADLIVNQTLNPTITDAKSLIASGATITVGTETGPGLYAGSNMSGITQLYWLKAQGHDISKLKVVQGAFNNADQAATAQGAPTLHSAGKVIAGITQQPIVAPMGHEQALEVVTGEGSHGHQEPVDTTQPMRSIFESPYAGHCTYFSLATTFTASGAEIQRFQELMMEMTRQIVDPLQQIMEAQEHRVWMPGPGYDMFVFEGMIEAHKMFGWRSDWAPGFPLPQ